MPNFFKYFNPEPFLGIIGTVSLSIAAQPVITTAINSGAKKVTSDTPYPQGIKESLSSPFQAQLQQSYRIMKRRLLTSIIPAAISLEASKKISQEFPESERWSTQLRLGINVVIETCGGALMEPREKFNAANSKEFPIAADLSRINRETFFTLAKKAPETSHFGEEHWRKLENHQKIFNENFRMRLVMLAFRNTAFCSASVGAGPLGKEFANANAELFKEIGLDQKQSELTSTMMFRSGFACLTVPFDSTVTKLSSGELSANQIIRDIYKQIKRGRLGVLFVGAAARTVLSTTTSTTVANGPDVGKAIEKIFNNFITSFSENPIYKLLTQLPSRDLAEEFSQYHLDLLDKKIGSGIDVVDDVVETLETLKILPEEVRESSIKSAISMQNIGEKMAETLFAETPSKSDVIPKNRNSLSNSVEKSR